MPLETGVYDIYRKGMCYVFPIYKAAQFLIPAASIQVGDEPWIHRLTSYEIPGREDNFCDEIRNRDRKCVILELLIPKILI